MLDGVLDVSQLWFHPRIHVALGSKVLVSGITMPGYFFLVLSNLLLDLLQAAVEGRKYRRPGAGSYEVMRRLCGDVDLSSRSIKVFEVNRNCDGVDPVEKPTQSICLFNDDLLILLLQVTVSRRYIYLHGNTSR